MIRLLQLYILKIIDAKNARTEMFGHFKFLE